MRNTFLIAVLSLATTLSAAIKMNQVGFRPDAEKTATLEIKSAKANPVKVTITNDRGDVVWTGKASQTMLNPISGKPRQIVDFSSLTTPGYYIMVAGKDRAALTIAERPYEALSRAAVRAYYYQRASMAIEEPYAEGWPRVMAHPDNHVLVHASAASDARPENTVINSTGGWYDAGDYNKYIVNSAYTVAVMMYAFEQHPDYFAAQKLNIPESANAVPDLLDELWYNIRWMMTMQDADGGVYHKLTTPSFEGFIRPDECKKPRYVVKKTTPAALDLAATLAMALRVYKPYKAAFPELYTKGMVQAIKAYEWAKKNPHETYRQNEMNEQFAPAITTGAYDDEKLEDEFFWAATELYLATGDERYRHDAMKYRPTDYRPAEWGNVNELGQLEWINQPKLVSDISEQYSRALIAYIQPFAAAADSSIYRSPYGNRAEDFFWGCNGEGCCWRGVQLMQAYRLTGDENYKTNAQRCLNHLLGQNATGYCYITGFGSKPTSHPHHRLSFSHVNGTHPGFMAGGPNRMQQDRNEGMVYPKNIPADECYLDLRGSYATNEIAINWNATLVALLADLDL